MLLFGPQALGSFTGHKLHKPLISDRHALHAPRPESRDLPHRSLIVDRADTDT